MSDTKPKLYEFAESCWANVPKIAIIEAGYPEGSFEWVSINLLEGANFKPEYLKINPEGTVPSLVVDGKTYTNSADATREIIARAPHPPRVSAHSSTSIIEEIHAAAHDSNATLLTPTDPQDKEAKAAAIAKAFLGGRQKALDQIAPEAPAEFKAFLDKKREGNQQLLDFYNDKADEKTAQQIYENGKQLWKSVGILIRGVVTQAIQKTEGPFLAGKNPGEADFHLITWLARTASNAGVEQGSPSSVAIPKLIERTGGHNFDPVIAKYWDAWIQRESFTKNKLH